MGYFMYDGARLFFEEFGNGNDKTILLLHGNTVSSKFFVPVITKLSEKYHVIMMDFIGNGQSERIENWPEDLWYEWSKQATALIKYLGIKNVNVIGCSGGALAAINLAFEAPDLINAVIADSFEGLQANANITEQIIAGREFAKQNEGFRSMLKMMHGDDWEKVLDADTEAVVKHALNVGSFCHKKTCDLQIKLLLTGSKEDGMFPEGHYSKLFDEICSTTEYAEAYIFEQGGHPAMMSNMDEFVSLAGEFFGRNN